MSRSAFARDFKSTLGVTPMEFVTRIRLNLARRLLVSTVLPVDAIAAEVGFNSRSHFSRVFRDHYEPIPQRSDPGISWALPASILIGPRYQCGDQAERIGAGAGRCNPRLASRE